VQHIDVAQGPLERRYGLATLSIYTAGTEYARVDLPGLRHERAVAIRDHLLPGHDRDAGDGT
jgi:membrane protein YdbS with pleckstrin-like domain